ncbi:hypothetical protein BGI40_01675 [Snodgrassella communis]|uniref:hypothetical protein n=1 Tax=Snodgrassella communis TaxID=2946699 RepID=UPI000568159E|nr:hypothetical protein [Snodgrassella communis]PIT10692.1 hypothetical protein BGI29_01625 [Snodgrassella communis]PIT30360.1 hypothetical protein BGI39_00705 [Snodgrassella communis]PIT30486.1 hypothetical protein BGI38_00760 [Snodgrassella communis]PIT37119.1 hypothetical protein BGI40_01675 [Snodgrassella communis]
MIEVTKAKKVETKASEISYPVVRKSKVTGDIILVYEENSGVVIKSDISNPYSDHVGTVLENLTFPERKDVWEPVDAHIYG